MPDRNRSWPYQGQATSPAALSLSPDGLLRSNRPLAGVLRNGTGPDVGPAAREFGSLTTRGDTDLGMDRVTPRDMDHIGVSKPGAPPPESTRIRR